MSDINETTLLKIMLKIVKFILFLLVSNKMRNIFLRKSDQNFASSLKSNFQQNIIITLYFTVFIHF